MLRSNWVRIILLAVVALLVNLLSLLGYSTPCPARRAQDAPAGLPAFQGSPERCPSSTELSLSEAEILVYLLPVAHKLREEQMDVGWELQRGSKWNEKDFYVFWVVNPKRVVEGSNTVGYFAVNKHTADIWDDWAEAFVTSTEIEGVQRILRKAHCIDDRVLSEFGSRRP